LGGDLAFLDLGFLGVVVSLFDPARVFLLYSFKGADSMAGILLKAAKVGALNPRAGIGPAR
jgi:hypothetical protein